MPISGVKSGFADTIKYFAYIAVLAFLLLLPFIASSKSNVSFVYQLSAIKTEKHYLTVELTMDGIEQAEIDLKMPVWTPSYYWILDLPTNVFDFEIKDGQNQTVAWSKTDKNTWRIATNGIKNITVVKNRLCILITC